MGREPEIQKTRFTSIISIHRNAISARSVILSSPFCRRSICQASYSFVLMQIMANSLNGLKVGDSHPVPENVMESPARLEIRIIVVCFIRLLEDLKSIRKKKLLLHVGISK